MKIVVIVPCFNEKPYLRECVEAIYNNDLPDGTELIVNVVDGMSTDGSRELIQQLSAEFDKLFLIDNIKRFTPFAFNLGVTSAEADYYQIVGARHIISENYLKKELDILQSDRSIWCVGGRIINEYENKTSEAIASVMGTSLGVGMGNFRTLSKSGYTDTVTSPMYPSWVFEKIGYFDEELVRNQDDDFNFRITNAGGKIYYEHDISLKYYVRGDYSKLRKQYFQYGYWKVYVNKKHKTITTLRQIVPPLFVIYSFLFIITLFTSKVLGTISFLPLFAYLLLISYEAYNLSHKNPSLKFWNLFKTFPIIHFSYGLGYLKGIWNFLVVKQKPSDKQKQISR